MRKVLVGGLLVALIGVGLGCQNGKMRMPWEKNEKSATTQMSAKDDCAMCTGVQPANADGTCPKCGMKVK